MGVYRDRAREGDLQPRGGATKLKTIEETARHLHEIEEEGESPATPAISIVEVMLVIGPIFVLIVGLSFLAYYLFS